MTHPITPSTLDAAFSEGRWGDVRRIPTPARDFDFDDAFAETLPKGKPVASPSHAHDPVNHPSHYKRGGMEAIDVIEAFELDFALGNACKYLLRAGHKDGYVQDLRKAKYYIQRAIDNADDEGKAA